MGVRSGIDQCRRRLAILIEGYRRTSVSAWSSAILFLPGLVSVFEKAYVTQRTVSKDHKARQVQEDGLHLWGSSGISGLGCKLS